MVSRREDGLWSFAFIVLLLANFGLYLVGQTMNTGLSIYLDRSGFNGLHAGFLAAVFSLTAGVFRIVCGHYVDRHGRKKALVIGTFFLLLGTVAFLVYPTLIVMTLGRVFQGIGFGVASTAASTASADVLPRERLGEGISLFALGQALALAVGPGVGIYLAGTDPARNLFYAILLFTVLTILCTFSCTYEKRFNRLPATSAYRERMESQASLSLGDEDAAVASSVLAAGASAPDVSPWKRVKDLFEWRALPGAVPIALHSAAFSFIAFFVGIYATELQIPNISIFYILIAVTVLLLRLFASTFMDKVPARSIAFIPFVAGLVAYAMIFAASRVHVLLYLAGVFYGVFLGVSTPLNLAVAVKCTPPERWGSANGLFYLAMDIGYGVAAMVWGIISDVFGFSAVLVCIMLCIVCAYVLSLVLYPKE